MYNTTHEIVTNIKQSKPLILNITNEVTMGFVANGLLSIGASPVMSRAPQEAMDLVTISKAVLINPGTLNDAFILLCREVCMAANELGKPLILDPVGAGASQYRTLHCRRMLEEFNPAIIRGNASEIMALLGKALSTKGVDSVMDVQLAVESAQTLAQKHNTTVVISGAVDAIVDSNGVEYVNHGSSIMPMITGTGCLLSAVVGAFRAVHDHSFDASVAATLFYSVCGELAERQTSKPGTFKTCFLDALSLLPERGDYA